MTPKLRWSPPTLSSPVTRNVSGTSASANGSGGDMVVNVTGPLTKRLIIENARHVKMIGGEVNITSGALSDDEAHGIVVKNCTGDIFIEGLYLHGSELAEGFQIGNECAVTCRVFLQNCRVDFSHSRTTGNPVDANHADCIQAYGPCAGLYVHRFTGISDYQSVFISGDVGDVGSTWWSRVNWRFTEHIYTSGGVHTHPNTSMSLHYLGRTTPAVDALIGDVWLEPRTNITHTKEEQLFPYGGNRTGGQVGWSEAYRAIAGSDSISDFVTWPSVYAGGHHPIIGKLRFGLPRTGIDFVTTADCGMAYTSPGYI